jgi:hypothetical protein
MQFCCKGSDGPIGPQGPAGTANVQYSKWFSPSVWNGNAAYGDWYFDTIAVGITQSLIDSGAILAYMKLPGDSLSVRPLPYFPTSQGIIAYDYAIPSVGKIRFTFVSNASDTPSTAIEYRYVLIPGGFKLGKQLRGNQPPYETLKQLFEIRD